jgi:alkyldihydroxyacetonephosphate synthase
MNRILWINSEDCCAHIEAGICGRDLVQELERRGLTIGHEPDSIEFSTLGGWIATKASGMKRNKYGNIEDIVKEVNCVSSVGVLFHGNSFLSGHQSHSVIGRRATGMELSPFMMGSEGCLGIITSAVVKVWPIAQRKEFECIVLPSFEVGIRFMKDLSKAQSLRPASVRLVDNVQFRFGQSLKEDSRKLSNTAYGKISQLVAEKYYGFHSDSAVGVTIAFEGCEDEVQAQKKHIRKLSSLHGGLLAGSSHGQAGYDLTFAIAYLRDFALVLA